jgi:hypothetical protein
MSFLRQYSVGPYILDFYCQEIKTAIMYQKGSEYFVDLIWWDITWYNYIVEEGIATVKLPKKG